MRYLCLTFAFIATTWVVCAAGGRASIDVVAITHLGESVTSGGLALIDPATGKRLTSIRGFHATDVPYGEYVLQLRVPGFKYHEQRLGVASRTEAMKVGLERGLIRLG